MKSLPAFLLSINLSPSLALLLSLIQGAIRLRLKPCEIFCGQGRFRGKRGGQFGVGLLVTLLDIATANNTVAIVMANPIAKEISEDYGISARKTASLLDTFSCISQGILPYGAQMLVALSAVHELGYELSAFEVMPLLFYPGMLFISSLICIFLLPERGDRAKAKK